MKAKGKRQKAKGKIEISERIQARSFNSGFRNRLVHAFVQAIRGGRNFEVGRAAVSLYISIVYAGLGLGFDWRKRCLFI